MKACRFHQTGPVEVLQYEDVPDPVPGEGDVVVRVRAAAINRLDIFLRSGAAPMPGFKMPHTGGFDISVGAVAALASVIAAIAINIAGPIGLAAAPATGALCGILNGFLISRLSVQPVIATLGTLLAARGVALAIGRGDQTVTLNPGNDVLWLGFGQIFEIPVSFLIVLGVVVVATAFSSFSKCRMICAS